MSLGTGYCMWLKTTDPFQNLGLTYQNPHLKDLNSVKSETMLHFCSAFFSFLLQGFYCFFLSVDNVTVLQSSIGFILIPSELNNIIQKEIHYICRDTFIPQLQKF